MTKYMDFMVILELTAGYKNRIYVFHVVFNSPLCIIAAITSGALKVSPHSFAATLAVLRYKSIDFNVILELTVW